MKQTVWIIEYFDTDDDEWERVSIVSNKQIALSKIKNGYHIDETTLDMDDIKIIADIKYSDDMVRAYEEEVENE